MKTITMMRVMRRVRERARSMLLMSLRRSIMRPWKRPPPLLSSERKTRKPQMKTSVANCKYRSQLNLCWKNRQRENCTQTDFMMWKSRVKCGEKHFQALLKGLEIFTDKSFYFRDKSLLMRISTSPRMNVFLMTFYPSLNRKYFFSTKISYHLLEPRKCCNIIPSPGEHIYNINQNERTTYSWAIKVFLSSLGWNEIGKKSSGLWACKKRIQRDKFWIQFEPRATCCGVKWRIFWQCLLE